MINKIKNAKDNPKPIDLVSEAKDIINAVSNQFFVDKSSWSQMEKEIYIRHMKRNSLCNPCDNNKDLGRNAIRKGKIIAVALDLVTEWA